MKAGQFEGRITLSICNDNDLHNPIFSFPPLNDFHDIRSIFQNGSILLDFPSDKDTFELYKTKPLSEILQIATTSHDLEFSDCISNKYNAYCADSPIRGGFNLFDPKEPALCIIDDNTFFVLDNIDLINPGRSYIRTYHCENNIIVESIPTIERLPNSKFNLVHPIKHAQRLEQNLFCSHLTRRDLLEIIIFEFNLNTNTIKELQLISIRANYQEPLHPIGLCDGNLLVYGFGNGRVEIYSPRKGTLIDSWNWRDITHFDNSATTDNYRSLEIMPFPNPNQLLLYQGDIETLCLFNINTREVKNIPLPPYQYISQFRSPQIFSNDHLLVTTVDTKRNETVLPLHVPEASLSRLAAPSTLFMYSLSKVLSAPIECSDDDEYIFTP